LDGNVYEQRKDIRSDYNFAFTPHSYGDYIFCISNILNDGLSVDMNNLRSITFNLNLGQPSDAAKKLETKEKLKPLEAEIAVLETEMQSIVHELEYLKERELRMRDTNGLFHVNIFQLILKLCRVD
jgi:hypothetical protein